MNGVIFSPRHAFKGNTAAAVLPGASFETGCSVLGYLDSLISSQNCVGNLWIPTEWWKIWPRCKEKTLFEC